MKPKAPNIIRSSTQGGVRFSMAFCKIITFAQNIGIGGNLLRFIILISVVLGSWGCLISCITNHKVALYTIR